MLFQRGNQRVSFLAERFGPNPDSPIGGARVNRSVFRDRYGVNGVLVSFNGLNATEVGSSPYFQAFIPRNRIDETVVNGEASDGVGMLYPEPFLVTANGYVVLREHEAAQTVVDSWESR